MSKGIVIRLSGTLMLPLVVFFNGYLQDVRMPPVRLMFYNVENLFDTFDDTLKEDDEFLPEGLRRWNITRYNRKINALYKTIIAAGEWNPPVLVALCETENRKVLEDLVSGTYLSKFNYSIVHEDSPDQRGIDVSLIYRKDLMKIVDFQYWMPSYPDRNDFSTRSVLYARCIILKDTVHVIVNHWPSRRGGVLAAEDQRSEFAEMVRFKADSITGIYAGGAKIIIMGDFNCTPDSPVIKMLTDGKESEASFFNLSENVSEGSGTYRYMGTWEMIDQVIVSEKLINCNDGLFTDSNMFRIFKPEFLLKKDPKYPGESPLSTYSGYRYQGGFSDHLPVLLDLKIRHDDQKE